MAVKKLKSSNSECAIKSVYDSERKDLQITFPSGSKYIYTPVSEQFAEQFAKAKSRGNFFNKHIRNNIALTSLKLV